MECKYCHTDRSDGDDMASGHPGCIKQRDDRKRNGQCIKCKNPIDSDIVYHPWCTTYSKYVPPAR